MKEEMDAYQASGAVLTREENLVVESVLSVVEETNGGSGKKKSARGSGKRSSSKRSKGHNSKKASK